MTVAYDLPTFDYGDRNADLTALAATILDGPADVNSQDEDTDSTAMEAHQTFQGTSDTSRHIRHFMEAHLDDTRLEEEDTDSTAMESQPTFHEQLNAASHSPSLQSRSVTQRGKSFQPLQHSADNTMLHVPLIKRQNTMPLSDSGPETPLITLVVVAAAVCSYSLRSRTRRWHLCTIRLLHK